MRIGIDARFLTHPQRGGFKTYTHTLVSALAQSGTNHEFLLYTDRAEDRPPLDLPDGFDIRPVGGNLIMREQLTLPAVMRRDRVDVAHFLCNTAPVLSGLRTVVTIHDTIPLRNGSSRKNMSRKQMLLQRYWQAVIPRAARTADVIVAGSAYVRDDLRERFALPGDRIRIVPVAINPMFFGDDPGAPPPGVVPEMPFILAFGSADGRKNHVSAIQAFSAIAPEFAGLRMVLVCSHPGVRDTLASVGNVIPVGPVSQRELLWLYRNALLLVFPSLDEGFGLPPVEAMACGTPVVVSNAGSLPEVVGDCGIFADPQDVAGIAVGMRALISDSDLRRSMGEEGRRHAEQYSPIRMGQGLIEAYEAAFR